MHFGEIGKKIAVILLVFKPLSLSALDYVPLFSYVIPGSVEIYEGEWLQGLGTLGIYAGARNRVSELEDTAPKLVVTEDSSIPTTTTTIKTHSALDRDTIGSFVFQTQMISSYNVYRIRGGHKENYSDILLAPFNPRQIFRPISMVSLLIAGSLLGRSNDQYRYEWDDKIEKRNIEAYVFGRLAYMPAVSEEMFFRGYLNTELSKAFGPWVGVPLSSLAFGLVHEGVGIQASAAMAGAAGLALGVLQVSNDYNISQGVALHFWFNFMAGLQAIRNGGVAPNLLSYQFQF